MLKLLNFLGTAFTILLLGFIFYVLFSGVKYLGENASKTEDTDLPGVDDEKTEKSLLGKAMDKVGDLGGKAKDKIADGGTTLKKGSQKTYDKVSEKLNAATEKMDQAVSDLKTDESKNDQLSDKGNGYSEADEAAEARAAKREAEMKKALADKKETLTSKGGNGNVAVNTAPDSSRKKSGSSSAGTAKPGDTGGKVIPKSYNETGKSIAKSASKSRSYYYTIVSSFKNKSTAQKEANRYKSLGYPTAEVVQFGKNYNVSVQRNKSKADALKAVKKLESKGTAAYVRHK